jgi:hypothetical protein
MNIFHQNLRLFILLTMLQLLCGRNLPKIEEEDILINENSQATHPICLRKLRKDLEMLKSDVARSETEEENGYEKIIHNYLLGKNTTEEVTTKAPKEKSTFQKIVEKIKNFFRFNKSEITECSAIKRDVSGEEDGEYEVSFEDELGDYESLAEPARITASDVEYLKKMIDCFKNNPTKPVGDRISLSKNDDTTKICITFKKVLESTKSTEEPRIPTTTTSKSLNTMEVLEVNREPTLETPQKSDQETNSSQLKLENKLKYMAHLHHPVSLTGKTNQKSLDLKKVQELIDSLKYQTNIFGDNEDENNNEKKNEAVTEVSDVPIFPYFFQDNEMLKNEREMNRETRSSNIFDSFTKKIKSLVSSGKDDSGDKIKGTAKKDYGDYDYPDENFDDSEEMKSPKKHQRVFLKSKSTKIHHENIPEDSDKIEPKPSENETQLTEDDEILTDFQDIQQQINPSQQIEIESFLKQLKDNPKPFEFDIGPLMQSKLHEIETGSVENQNKKAEQVMDGDPNKYFEFLIPDPIDISQSPVPVKNGKRNAVYPNYYADNSRNIERMKNDLINEYKNNYENVYKNAIQVNKYKSYLEADEKKLNDFVDKYYLLNDGVTDLEIPRNKEADKINMQDLNIDLKLNHDFQDLEYERNLENGKFQENEDQVPPHKLEVNVNKDIDGFSP